MTMKHLVALSLALMLIVVGRSAGATSSIPDQVDNNLEQDDLSADEDEFWSNDDDPEHGDLIPGDLINDLEPDTAPYLTVEAIRRIEVIHSKIRNTDQGGKFVAESLNKEVAQRVIELATSEYEKIRIGSVGLLIDLVDSADDDQLNKFIEHGLIRQLLEAMKRGPEELTKRISEFLNKKISRSSSADKYAKDADYKGAIRSI